MNRVCVYSARMLSTPLCLLVLALGISPLSTTRAECPNFNLATPSHFTTGANPLYLVTADLNEDGILDVAVSNGDFPGTAANSSVAVLLGTGPRAYAAPVLYAVGSSPGGIVAADFDEDGILDLAVTNCYGHSVSILRGRGAGDVGNGSFAPPVSFPTGQCPFQMVAADFDEDGILDLAFSLNQEPGVSVLRGQGSGGVGDGTFSAPVIFPLNDRSTGLDQGDFNNDGNVDLVATENYHGTFAVLLGNGSGSFAPAVHYAGGDEPFDLAVGDFDEDGWQDLAVANTASGGTQVLLGNGSGGFTAHQHLPSGNSAGVTAHDMNQDGILDLAVAQATGSDGGDVRLYLGQGSGGVGSGSFAAPQIYSVGADAYQIAAGDFDGDGHHDLLVSCYLRDFVSLLPGTCAAPPPDPRNPVLTDVRDVPNDQGGKVFLTWDASSLDSPGGAVVSYRVWRRIPPALAPDAAPFSSKLILATRGEGPESATTIYWEALATLPAQRLPGYGYTAATTQDSMRHANPYTAFFVSALTNNIDVFYSSNVDSGYSVDNIRPRRPESLSGQIQGSGYVLSWNANDDPDLAAYHLYRGSSADFVPAEANRIAALNNVEYMDASGTGAEYYKLSAVDEHGNESEYAVLRPSGPTAIGGADFGFGLRGVRPNPSRSGELTIDLTLARGGAARVEILDLVGRRIASRDLDGVPGDHSVTFRGGQRLPVGVYLVRLVQGAQEKKIKAVVMH